MFIEARQSGSMKFHQSTLPAKKKTHIFPEEDWDRASGKCEHWELRGWYGVILRAWFGFLRGAGRESQSLSGDESWLLELFLRDPPSLNIYIDSIRVVSQMSKF